MDQPYQSISTGDLQLTQMVAGFRPFAAVTGCSFAGTSLTAPAGAICSPINNWDVTINYNVASSTTRVTGTIPGFVNPFSLSREFSLSATYKVGCTGTGIQKVMGHITTLTAAILDSNALVLSVDNPIVGKQRTKLKVDITPKTIMPLRGTIILKFPAYYTHDSTEYSMVTNSFTVVDHTASNFQTFTDFQYIQGTNEATMNLKYRMTFDAVTNPSIYGYSGSALSFSIQGFNNPISQSQVTGFKVQILDIQGNIIDDSASLYSFTQTLTPATLLNAGVFLQDSFGNSFQEIGVKGSKLQFTFSLDFPVEEQCYFMIKFPREVMIDIDDTITQYFGNGYGYSTSLVYKSPYKYNADLTNNNCNCNYIILQGCVDYKEWTQPSSYQDQGIITIGTVVSPGQLKSTDKFEIIMYKDSSYTNQIASTVSSVASSFYKMYIPYPGSLTNSMNFRPHFLYPITDNTIEGSTDFFVNFTLTKNLYSDSVIEIELPSKVKVGPPGQCQIISQSYNVYSNAFCNYVNTTTIGGVTINSFVYIYNAFVSSSKEYWSLDLSTTSPVVNFTINSIINPRSTSAAGSWWVRTKNYLGTTANPTSSNWTVDAGQNSVSYTPQRGTLVAGTVGVTPSDYTNYKQNIVYTFAIRVSHTVPNNGYIKFKFPSDFFELNGYSCSNPSSTGGTLSLSGSCSTTSPSSRYIIYLQLTTGDLLNDREYQIAIGGVRNPRSTKPTDNIEITTYDTNKIDEIDFGTGFIVTMRTNDLTSFSTLTASFSNLTNGAIQSYTIIAKSDQNSQVPFKTGDYLYMTWPATALLPSQASCVNSGSVTVSCSNAGQTLIVFLSSVSGTFTQTVQFSVRNVTNPSSTRPSAFFTNVYVLDQNGYEVMKFRNSTPLQIKTTTAANLLRYSLYQDNLALETKATYRLEFLPTNRIGENGTIVITWPSQVTIDSRAKVLVTTNQKRSPVITISTSSRTITIQNATQNISGGYLGLVQIEINPVTNPRDNRVLNGFKIDTYDDFEMKYKIDKLDDNLIKPKTECNFPCKTCLGSDMDYCLSCWADGDQAFLQSTSSGGQTCSSSCDQSRGFTTNGDKSKVCTKCDPTCKTCVDEGAVGDKFRCRSCSDVSRYFYPTTRKCSGSCENGFYESSRFTCSSCQQPCQQCNTTATTCTDCFKDSRVPFLYAQTCVGSCPSGFTGVEQACLKCQAPCDTCFNSTQQCLTCNQKGLQKFLFAFQCFENCPINTVADTQKMICKGCLTGCKKCDSQNQTKCFECQNPLVLFDNGCLTDCPSGYKRNSAGTGCDPTVIKDLTLVYFPHVIGSLLLIVLAIGGYFKDKKSVILSNIIVLFGPIELLATLVQLLLSLVYSSVIVTGATGFSLISYIVLNCVFASKFNKLITNQDTDYQFWQGYHQKTYKFIITATRMLSFKMIRLNYSFLYGFDIFKARFTNPQAFRDLLRNFSLLHFFFSSLPLIGIDVIIILQNVGVLNLNIPSFSAIPIEKKRFLAESSTISSVTTQAKTLAKSYGIDSQIEITIIETLFISLLMTLLTVCEFCKIERYLAFDYNEVDQESMAFLSQTEDKADKQLRRDMLKKIMQQVKGNQDLINENAHINKTQDLVNAFGRRRCKSMTTFDNEQEQDPREVRSEPPQQMPDWDEEEPKKIEFTDNVYAESQPSDPLGKVGKEFVDFHGQVTPDDFSKIISRKGGDFVPIDSLDGGGQMSYRKKKDRNKKRGRKNQYYTQIDAEDDQEAENMELEMETIGDEVGRKTNFASPTNMGVIKEVEDDNELNVTMPKKENNQGSGKKKQVKISEDKEQIEKQMRKIEEEAAVTKKAQEDALKLQDEQLAKQQQQQQYPRSPTFGQQSADPPVQVPPEANKRTFNENDILGDFDRDEKSNIIILQDQDGNYVDKLGRRVNERGYLINPQGDIIENQKQQTMFEKEEIDDRGEIPAPFCVEKHNFNPFKIRGEFNLDKNRQPIITKNRNGDLVDKYGRMVNRKGWLIDKKGNVVDFMGVKKFDQRLLNPDNGDLPRLFNYGGQRYDILDICGAFDLNPHNGEIVLKTNAQGQHFDKFGRLVNSRGYLVDYNGNIVDKDGRKIFDKRYLSANGEIPKIFPFSKFNIQNILGDFEMDPMGNPILEKHQDGNFYDRQGKMVNQRGYFCDEQGNITDKKGKIMFNKEILEQDGEIPEVFRAGLLKSDTASSLSRLMSEIERNQPEEMYNNIPNQVNRSQNRSRLIGAKHGSGGDTSEESGMEDTPSNYNQMNQRYFNGHAGDIIQEEDEHRRRKKSKKRKKKPVQEYTDPSEKDIKLAKAYGGVAKPLPKRQLPKGQRSPRSSISNQRTLNKVAGSIAGFQRNHQSRRELEETKSNRGGLEALHHNQSAAILNDTNDPSMMAVPEHHLREERLKKQKLKELRLKGKLKKKNGMGDPDFEKMFGKDIDEFLEDSDWDIESFDNMSQYSRGTAKSAFLDGRIRGLESIYLQRLESQMKKGGASKSKRMQNSKPKFRVMQDRFIDDPSLLVENVEGRSSNMSQQRNHRIGNNQSAMNALGMRNMSVTAQTQFRPTDPNQRQL